MYRPLRTVVVLLSSLALAATGLVAAGGAATAGTAESSSSAGPAVTAPGTLVFIKNHNVWMSRGDGTGQVQLTSDGTNDDKYSKPTMSSAGIVTTVYGDSRVVRFRTDGTAVASWDSKTLFPVGEAIYQNTTSVSVSPDGTKAAYGQYAYVDLWQDAVGAKYSAPNQLTTLAPSQLNFSDPAWISNSRVILRNEGGIFLYDVGGGAPVEWFDEQTFFGDPSCDIVCPNEDLVSPELSADGSSLVTMRGPNFNPSLAIFAVTGNPVTSIPPTPTLVCNIVGDNDSDFGDPTIAPNNKTIAWEAADGVWTKDDLHLCGVSDARLLIPGASDPSWSAATYAVPTPPKPDPKPEPKPGDKIALVAAPSIKGAAKVGKKLKASTGSWKPSPKKFAYQWKRNGKAIKKATKSTYKLKKADAGKKITVTVTATRASFKKASATSKAKAVALFNVKKPKIKKATAKVGTKLKATKGTWKGKPTKITYQWYRGKKAIKGATKATYKIKKADRGKKIRVKVTAKRAGYPKSAVYTARTKKVR